MKNLANRLTDFLPDNLRETFFLRAFGFLKIPMLHFVRPSVVELTDDRCVVKIPFNRRTKNHLNSMYFAALAAGADCAGGLIAMRLIQKDQDGKMSLIFKDFKAEFLKRAHGDTHFICEQGQEIRKFVQKAAQSGERENMTVYLTAVVPSVSKLEPVARFELTLSVKKKV
jgi:acyl-coenzyme A thioesterase PaaI-like protein